MVIGWYPAILCLSPKLGLMDNPIIGSVDKQQTDFREGTALLDMSRVSGVIVGSSVSSERRYFVK